MRISTLGCGLGLLEIEIDKAIDDPMLSLQLVIAEKKKKQPGPCDPQA